MGAGGVVPFAILFIILLASRRSLVVASAAFLFVTATLASLVWYIVPTAFAGALAKGLLVSLDITLVVAGSLFFLDVLKKTRVLSSLEHYLHRMVPDSRVQALLIVWLFGGLIEGAAGFGTPAAVVAPLLVHLGFSAIGAASLSLAANTVPVSFGAVGTPLRVGFSGMATGELTRLIGTFGALLAIGMPIILVYMLAKEIKPHQGVIGPHGFSHAKDSGSGTPSSIMPFAIWSGVVFAVPYWLSSQYSPEFPALVGALTGLLVTMAASTQDWWRRLFLPRITQRIRVYDPNELPLHMWRVLLPYGLMTLFLVLGKFFLPTYSLRLPADISHDLSLFNPGLIMLFLGGLFAIHGHLSRDELRHTAVQVGRRMVRMAAIISMLVAATQLMVHSGNNSSGMDDMLAGLGSLLRRENIGIFGPLIGALGGFAAGSTTVSNLMFGEIQWNAALSLGTSTLLVAALQMFGATAGNAMSLSNITAIEAALGIKHQVRGILRKLVVPISLYSVLVILLGAALAIGM